MDALLMKRTISICEDWRITSTYMDNKIHHFHGWGAAFIV